MMESLKKFDNYCNIAKKDFTALEIMQLMKSIAIFHTSSLFDPLKAINTTFAISFCSLDIGY